MSNTTKHIQPHRLIGVEEGPFEAVCDTLVFHLEAEPGTAVRLTYADLMQTLRFAEAQGAIPKVSENWWGRTFTFDGCTHRLNSSREED